MHVRSPVLGVPLHALPESPLTFQLVCRVVSEPYLSFDTDFDTTATDCGIHQGTKQVGGQQMVGRLRIWGNVGGQRYSA